MQKHFTRRGLGVVLIGTLAFASANSWAAEQSVVTPSSLLTRAGQAIELNLKLPNGESWNAVNIGRFISREPEVQRSLDGEAMPVSEKFSLSFDKPGYALVVIDVGPSSQKGQADSWRRTTYCTKLIVRVAGKGAKDEAANPGITAKVGSRVEILPLMDPAQKHVGDDLPVRVYYNGDKLVNQSVTGIGPDGKELTATSDSVGAATFRISAAGRWTIRFVKNVDGENYTAELMFDIAAASADAAKTKEKDVKGEAK